MNALFDHGGDLGDDVRVAARLAVLAGSPVAVRSAVGQVLRRRDRVDAAQVGHLAKHVRQRVAHPLAHRRMRSAEGRELVFPDAGHLGAILEEGGGHRPRLIHVEIHADAVFLGPLHQGPKIGQTPLVVGAELGKRRPARRQVAQDDVQPDAVDPHGGEPLQESVGIGIQLRIQQRIAVHGQIGIDEPQGNGLIVPRLRRGEGGQRAAELPNEVETRFRRAADLLAEILLDHATNLGRAAPRRLVRRLVAERLALGFQAAQLDPQKVILAQREGQSLRRHLQKFQQLVVGQEMPIAPDQRDVAARLHLRRNRRRRRQSHRLGQRRDVLHGSSQDLRQLGRLDGVPVPPDELVDAVGKMAARRSAPVRCPRARRARRRHCGRPRRTPARISRRYTT